MQKELSFTDNSLLDLINWLRDGYIICLHTDFRNKLFYYSKDTLDKITKEEIIYINVLRDSSLLDAGDWPWYIEDEGFVQYKSLNILPTDKTKIFHLVLN
jgi:hypothetical protein